MDKLLSQAAPFKPGYTLGDRAETIVQQEGSFLVTTQSGVKHLAPVVIIAGGLGSFEPRKPQIHQLANYEKKGLHYMVKNPDDFNGKKYSFQVVGIQHWIGQFILLKRVDL